SDRSQLSPVRDRPSRGFLPGGFRTGELQRQCRCSAPVQRCPRPSTQSKNAPPTLGGFVVQLGSRLSPLPAQANRASRGQTPAEALSLTQSTTPSLRGNLPSQLLLERTPPQLSQPKL